MCYTPECIANTLVNENSVAEPAVPLVPCRCRIQSHLLQRNIGHVRDQGSGTRVALIGSLLFSGSEPLRVRGWQCPICSSAVFVKFCELLCFAMCSALEPFCCAAHANDHLLYSYCTYSVWSETQNNSRYVCTRYSVVNKKTWSCYVCIVCMYSSGYGFKREMGKTSSSLLNPAFSKTVLATV